MVRNIRIKKGGSLGTYALLLLDQESGDYKESLESYIHQLVDNKTVGFIYNFIEVKSQDDLDDILKKDVMHRDIITGRRFFEDKNLQVPYKIAKVKVLNKNRFVKHENEFKQKFNITPIVYEDFL